MVLGARLKEPAAWLTESSCMQDCPTRGKPQRLCKASASTDLSRICHRNHATPNWLGRTPKGAYSTRGRSRHLLEAPFPEPLLRTLLRTLFYCKTHSKPPSQNPSENPFSRTLPRTFSEPFSERCVAVRPLRRAPYWFFHHNFVQNVAG